MVAPRGNEDAVAPLESSSAVGRPIVVELEIGLRLQRYEKREGKVPVRRLSEVERGAPVVEVTLQRHDLARELAPLDVVTRLPRCRPLLGEAEAGAGAQ